MEMPEDMRVDKDEYINTSNVRGKKRYQTDRLREMVNELEEAEDTFKEALIPFLRRMFEQFYEKRQILNRAVQCMAEIDCLCALAIISSNSDSGPMSRPEILEENGDEPYIELRKVRHPCVQD